MNFKENYGIIKEKKNLTSQQMNFSNFRISMQSDLDVYKSTLEQQSNVASQLRSLQDKITRDKNEYEEV